MNDSDYSEFHDRYSPEAEALYAEWENTRPSTPSDFPDENAAYVSGYLAACEKYAEDIRRIKELLK